MVSKKRGVWISLAALVVAVVVLLGVVVVPILTHTNTGSSGQVKTEEYVSKVTARGADGRTRTLKVAREDGSPIDGNRLVPGQRLRIVGRGFDSNIGIYVSFCQLPRTEGRKPGPCLGDVPASEESAKSADRAQLASRWITNNWAWRAFATDQYDGDNFSVTVVVPEPVGNGANCFKRRCGITTRADHTASKERVQDVYIPVKWQRPDKTR